MAWCRVQHEQIFYEFLKFGNFVCEHFGEWNDSILSETRIFFMLHDTNPKINKQPCFLLQNWGGGEGGGEKFQKNIFCRGGSIKSKGWLRAFGLQKFMFYGNHIKNFSFYFIFQVLKMLLPYYISNILINIIITSLKM